MNLLDIVIEQRDDSATGTIYDTDYGEPVLNEVLETAVTLQGQIKNDKDDRLSLGKTGDNSDSSGHLVFRKLYLEEQGITLKKGDLITSVAGVDFDAEIIEIRPKAPLGGQFLIVQVFFKQRTDTHGGGI